MGTNQNIETATTVLRGNCPNYIAVNSPDRVNVGEAFNCGRQCLQALVPRLQATHKVWNFLYHFSHLERLSYLLCTLHCIAIAFCFCAIFSVSCQCINSYITFVSEKKVVRGSMAGGVWDLHTYSVTSISLYTLKGMASSFRYNGVSTIWLDPVLMLFTRHAITQGHQCTIIANDTMPDSCIRSEGGDSLRDFWRENCCVLC